MPHSGHMILRAWWQKICHMGGWDHVMLNDQWYGALMLNDQWYGALQKAKYGMLLESEISGGSAWNRTTHAYFS